jgi:hypothetical protein
MKFVLIALLVSGCVVGEEPKGPKGDLDGSKAKPVPTNGLVLDRALASKLPVTALGTRTDDHEVVVDEITAATLAAPAGRDLLKYVAICALPADQELVAGDDRFDGFYGLAPEWATGSCGTECQHWVSACVLAHVNANGKPFAISLRGENAALRPRTDAFDAFTFQEAAFYGNLFKGEAHACWASLGGDEQKLAGRVCGLPGGCGFVIAGPCMGDPAVAACKQTAAAGGGFADCHTGNLYEFPRTSPKIHEVVTVYLKP